jgi:hypothetical protein
MDIGSISSMKSKFLNNTIIKYHSTRKPGFVYKFILKSGNAYRCCRCLELNKQRRITIENGKVVGKKHPEDDHHPDCEPSPEAVVTAEEIDREMRSEVKILLVIL